MKKGIIQPTVYISIYNNVFRFYDHSDIKVKPSPVAIAKPCTFSIPTMYPLQSQAFEEYDRRKDENIKVFRKNIIHLGIL